MLNVRLAGDHLFGKLLFTWLSLVISMMVSFCAVLFPTRCLGWNLELNWVSFWGFSFLLWFIAVYGTFLMSGDGATDFWDPGALKHLLHFSCQEICASNLLRLWCIEASALLMSQDLCFKSVETLVHWRSAAILMSKDLFFKSVDTLVHWSICSFYVKRCVLQICWYSGALQHLLSLCHKICASNLLILWYIEASAPLMSQDLCFKSVDTLVYWSICSSYVKRFVLQICWYSGTLKCLLLFLCYKICTANLFRLWCIEAPALLMSQVCASNLLILWYIKASALLMSQDLCFKSVDTLVYWSICSSYVTRFVFQICWYSGILKHLLLLCHKIYSSNLLILWYIEASALLMSQDLCFKSVETQVH